MLYNVLLEPNAEIKAYATCNPKEAKSYAEQGFAVLLNGVQVSPEEIDETADTFIAPFDATKSTTREVGK